MRVGLVLGAGGVVGASWLMGALDALETETGWKAQDAEFIVGTSAGSVVGAMLADGLEPAIMSAYTGGKSLDAYLESELRAAGVAEERMEEMRYRIERQLPSLGPASWSLAARTLLQPHRHPPGHLLAACLPRGFVSTQPIKDVVCRFVEGSWPDHPGYRAVAADLSTGKRVAFGDADAPPARVEDAVAASCAIPGFYCPPKIGGRRYVDGGICSPSNLDLLRGEELDLVICLNPMTSLAAASSWSPADRFAALMRAGAGRRLGHEARKLREEGTKVLILQPCEDDLPVMGNNFMSGSRRAEVNEQAYLSVARAVRGTAPELLPARSGRRRARSVERARRAAASLRRAA